MIKAVIFDWGGVLIERPTLLMFSYFAKYFEIPEKKFIYICRKYKERLQKGQITEEKFWREICKNLKIQREIPKNFWLKIFKKYYQEKKEIFLLVQELKKKGYKIGLLSNLEISTMTFFNEQKYDFFDVLVFSCMEGYVKPDKKIYEITLEKLGLKPGEAVFIDDRLENVKGAEEIGMNTIFFKDVDQLKKDIKKYISF